MRQLIRADGTFQNLPARVTSWEVERLIGAAVSDSIVLHHMGRPTHVMVVDDTGMVDRRPVNKAATVLYWQSCPKGNKPYPIHGDVLIMPADEFLG